MSNPKHLIRVTGILIEENSVLLVNQHVNSNRAWSLPGGKLEHGESLEDALIREMYEETGLNVSIDSLLYVTDKTEDNLLHITFSLVRGSGEIRLPTNGHEENPISNVKFVPIRELEQYGFSRRFQQLAQTGFPDSPKYAGSKQNIGL